MFAARRSDLTPAQRAHTRRVLWLLLAYAIVLPPLVWVRANTAVAGYIPMLMAIVASLPVLGIFASWGRYYDWTKYELARGGFGGDIWFAHYRALDTTDAGDEYHQAMTLRRIAIATNATMGAAVVWGFLQAFGVMPLVEAYWIPLVWVVIQGVQACFAGPSASAKDD